MLVPSSNSSTPRLPPCGAQIEWGMDGRNEKKRFQKGGGWGTALFFPFCSSSFCFSSFCCFLLLALPPLHGTKDQRFQRSDSRQILLKRHPVRAAALFHSAQQFSSSHFFKSFFKHTTTPPQRFLYFSPTCVYRPVVFLLIVWWSGDSSTISWFEIELAILWFVASDGGIFVYLVTSDQDECVIYLLVIAGVTCFELSIQFSPVWTSSVRFFYICCLTSWVVSRCKIRRDKECDLTYIKCQKETRFCF